MTFVVVVQQLKDNKDATVEDKMRCTARSLIFFFFLCLRSRGEGGKPVCPVYSNLYDSRNSSSRYGGGGRQRLALSCRDRVELK